MDEADRQRLKFLPVRDHYNPARWVAAVKQGLARLHPGQPSVVLVGHLKDATSSYLRDFPGWALDDVRDAIDHVRSRTLSRDVPSSLL